jgi:hypothetical protein
MQPFAGEQADDDRGAGGAGDDIRECGRFFQKCTRDGGEPFQCAKLARKRFSRKA